MLSNAFYFTTGYLFLPSVRWLTFPPKRPLFMRKFYWFPILVCLVLLMSFVTSDPDSERVRQYLNATSPLPNPLPSDITRVLYTPTTFSQKHTANTKPELIFSFTCFSCLRVLDYLQRTGLDQSFTIHHLVIGPDINRLRFQIFEQIGKGEHRQALTSNFFYETIRGSLDSVEDIHQWALRHRVTIDSNNAVAEREYSHQKRMNITHTPTVIIDNQFLLNMRVFSRMSEFQRFLRYLTATE